MPLQLRRGSETTISSLTPANGEPLWAEDTHKLFIGDGTTIGGHEIGGGGGGGAQGAQGYQGYQGFQGAQGVQGAQGDAGSAGAQGLQGAQGVQGSAGSYNQNLDKGSNVEFYRVTATQIVNTGGGNIIFEGLPGGAGITLGRSGVGLWVESNVIYFDEQDVSAGQSTISGSRGDGMILRGSRIAGPNSDGQYDASVQLNITTNSNAMVLTTYEADSYGSRPLQIRERRIGGTNHSTIAEFSTATGLKMYNHIVPSADDTYDLGSSTNKWRSLYVGTNTIFIGTATLTVQDSTLSVNGETIGQQGPQGFQGAQGNQGHQGNQGDAGAQGFQGHQGDTGAQGFQGHQGDTGAQGFQGNQGDAGAQGFQGNQGFQGAQGVQGGFASGSDATVATLTATVKLDVTTGTNISRSLVIGGEGVQGNGYYYPAVSSTNPSLLYVANAASGTQGRITLRTYGQNQPSGGATTVPVPIIIMEGSRGTHTAPTAVGSGDPIGGLNFSGYDGSGWAQGDRSLSPFLFTVLTAEAWAASGSTTTNAGTRFFMRDQPIGMQLNSTSRRGFMETSQTAVSGAPPTLVMSFNNNLGTTPTLTSSTGGTTFTGHGRMQANWINASQNMIAVTSADSAPDNNNLTGANFLQFVGVRKNAMTGRRNKLSLGDVIWNINFNGVTSDSNTGNGVTMAQIYASALENVSTTAYGADLVFKTVTKASTAIADRLKLASDSITIGSSDSLVVKTNSYNLQDSSANDIVTYTTGTDQVSILKKTSMTTATISTVLNLPIRTSEPAGYVAGSIVFADGNSWDPANYSTLTTYLTWYDGSNWRAIASV